MEQDKIGTDVALLLDKVYLQKDSQYQDGKLVGVDNQENLYKGVMTFIINSLKKFIPLIAKAIPEIKSNKNGFQNTLITTSHLLTVFSLMHVQLFQIITLPVF